METPVGMVYIDTRRQGDRVWVRVADFILPNIHQFPPNADPMADDQHQPAGGDDLGGAARRHPHDADRFLPRPEGRELRTGAGFGQDANRSYEERQRVPGDYDAQVSIHGGIARHGLEHLASTDRGVIMMRNMIRRGIRAVQQGADPRHNSHQAGQVISTYSQDRVIAGTPPAPTPEADQQLLREMGRKVVTDCQQLVQVSEGKSGSERSAEERNHAQRRAL